MSSTSTSWTADSLTQATGAATSTSTDLNVSGDLIVSGGITSGTSSSVHSIHVSDGSASSMNMGNEAEIVISDDGIPRVYFEDTGEGTNDKLMAIANYRENFVVQSLVDDGESYDVERILVCNRDGRVGIGTETFDSNAVYYLAIANGTEPNAHTDNQIYIGSKDATTTNEATLSLFCEEDPEASSTWNMSQRMKVWINGTEYWIALDEV